MKNYRVLDLTTERGKKIYKEIVNYYPSLEYGWQSGKEYLFAEGYNVIIDVYGNGHLIGKGFNDYNKYLL